MHACFRARRKREMTAKANAMSSAGGRPAKQRKAAALLAAKNYQPSLNFNPPVPWHRRATMAMDSRTGTVSYAAAMHALNIQYQKRSKERMMTRPKSDFMSIRLLLSAQSTG